MLRSYLCDYNDAYTVVKGIIFVTPNNGASRRKTKLMLKNNAPFRSRITKIKNSAEDLDIVMPMYSKKLFQR